MKILLGSHAFAPSTGGIESVGLVLAEQWQRMGHDVIVLTATKGGMSDPSSLRIVRRPTPAGLLRLVRWADVFFQNNISLRTAWPLPLIRRPWVVTTHIWLSGKKEGTDLGGRLKRRALRSAVNIYISQAIASHVGLPGTIIPNPYDTGTFRIYPEIQRDRALVFVGRLVSDKGVDTLLQALGLLKARGIAPPLTIVGDGAEAGRLRALAGTLGVAGQVEFTGPLGGSKLARLLNRHRVMVVPSRWAEPFGLVALEGIACGCAIVGSADGGLAEAIGPCGMTFANGSADALAGILAGLCLEPPRPWAHFSAGAPAHLSRHAPQTVAQRYLEAFRQSMGAFAR